MLIRNAVSRTDYQNIKQLFLQAFPKEERPPFFLLKNKAGKGKGTFLVIEEGKEFLGFFHLVVSDDLVYLAFFAMKAECRSHGYGSQALVQLKEHYQGRKILIAREKLDPSADNYAMRVRRYGFYCRNGFQDLPCEIIEGRVHYDAMSTAKVKPEEYNRLVQEWGSTWLTKIVVLKMKEA